MKKQILLEIDQEEVFDWEIERLETVLKEWGIPVGSSWSKSKKASQSNGALESLNSNDQETGNPIDTNIFMIHLVWLD